MVSCRPKKEGTVILGAAKGSNNTLKKTPLAQWNQAKDAAGVLAERMPRGTEENIWRKNARHTCIYTSIHGHSDLKNEST